jgi:hypothetical protein
LSNDEVNVSTDLVDREQKITLKQLVEKANNLFNKSVSKEFNLGHKSLFSTV